MIQPNPGKFLCFLFQGMNLQNLSTILSPLSSSVGKRIETMVYSKLDRQQPHRASPHELLGIELSRAGNEFGPETQYGTIL